MNQRTNPMPNARGRAITLSLSEIVSGVEGMEERSDKVAHLRAHDSKALRELVRLAYTDVEWRIPPGVPPFRPLEEWRGGEGHLYREIFKLGPFIKGTGEAEGINELRREKLFATILEYIDENDARLLCSVKDGSIPTVDETLAREAFPEVFAS